MKSPNAARFVYAISPSQAAPLTPLESPYFALCRSVETLSEKIYFPQIFGIFLGLKLGFRTDINILIG